MDSNGPHPPWEKRLDAVGAAQGRYLWILLVAGIFYLSLGLGNSPLDLPVTETVPTPVLGLELSPTAVWASGPAVLSLLILVVIGSIRATGVARRSLGLQGLGRDAEAFDAAPNAIDLAAYSTEKTPPKVQWLLGLSYPGYLTIFLLQAAYYVVLLWQLAPEPWAVIVAIPSTAATLWAGFMVVWFWRNRLPPSSQSESPQEEPFP